MSCCHACWAVIHVFRFSRWHGYGHIYLWVAFNYTSLVEDVVTCCWSACVRKILPTSICENQYDWWSNSVFVYNFLQGFWLHLNKNIFQCFIPFWDIQISRKVLQNLSFLGLNMPLPICMRWRGCHILFQKLSIKGSRQLTSSPGCFWSTLAAIGWPKP